MAHFVLVHGAWHGPWCWDRVAPLLLGAGHDVTAADLPISDGAATFEDYAAAVSTSAGNPPGDLVLVGHSLGCMTLPLVAVARPVTAMAFVCPVVPNVDGMPWDDAPPMDLPPARGFVKREDGSAVWPTLESATAAFYADCTTEDATWAYARLRPQNSSSLWTTPYPLRQLPDVPRVAVAGLHDPVTTIDHQRAVCPQRLGVDPVELPGGHSPFLARPDELARLLLRLTAPS